MSKDIIPSISHLSEDKNAMLNSLSLLMPKFDNTLLFSNSSFLIAEFELFK